MWALAAGVPKSRSAGVPPLVMGRHGRGWSPTTQPPQLPRWSCSLLVKACVWISAGKWAYRVPPFKVTEGHWNRHGSIGYLWLPINVCSFIVCSVHFEHLYSPMHGRKFSFYLLQALSWRRKDCTRLSWWRKNSTHLWKCWTNLMHCSKQHEAH